MTHKNKITLTFSM